MYNTDVKVSNGFSDIQSYNLRAGRGNDFNRGSFMHLLRWFPTAKPNESRNHDSCASILNFSLVIFSRIEIEIRKSKNIY